MRWGVIFLILVVLFAFGKSIVNKLSQGLAFFNAKKDAPIVYQDNNPVSPDSIRTTFVKGVCEAIKKELQSSYFFMGTTSETRLVQLLNSLANGQEVAFASTYYNQAYGVSLKAVISDQLDSGANPFGWFTQGHWNDLKSYVQQNLI